MGAVSAFITGNYLCQPLMTDVIVIQIRTKIKKNMELQPMSRTHQAFAQVRGYPLSTSKKGLMILTNIHSNYKKEEKPMGAVSALTTCRELPL